MRLDIVMPAHNEEERIDRTLRAYRAACPQAGVRFLVALDSCTDATPRIVAGHARADARVRVFSYPKLGKGGVIAATFERSDADLVGFVDADCATPPAELTRMTRTAANVDGVIASRRLPASVTPGGRGARRSLTSMGFAVGVRTLFRLPYADTQCGAKVVHRRVAERVVPLLSSRDFLFDVDLLVVARRLGFDLVEVPTVWIDQAGSKLHPARDSIRMLASAMRLWIHHRTMPIRPEHRPPPRPTTAAYGLDALAS